MSGKSASPAQLNIKELWKMWAKDFKRKMENLCSKCKHAEWHHWDEGCVVEECECGGFHE